MAFQPHVPSPADSVRRLTIRLQWIEGAMSAKYHVRLVDEDGNHVSHPQDTGNLIPYLTEGERADGIAFLNAVLAKAQSLIP